MSRFFLLMGLLLACPPALVQAASDVEPSVVEELEAERDEHRARRPVRAIEWRGVSVLETDVLEKSILTTRASRLPWRDYRPFDRDVLEQDRGRIQSAYRQNGYYEAEVDSEFEPAWFGGVRVVFTVREGPPVPLAVFSIGLPAQLPGSVDRERLVADLPLREGEPFSVVRYRASREALLARLAEKGYPQARVAGGAQVSVEHHSAIVHWTVAPGPFVEFGPVEIFGLDKVEEKLLRAELEVLELRAGEPYSTSRMRKAQRALYDLGLFRSVSIEAPRPRTESEEGAAPPDAAGSGEAAVPSPIRKEDAPAEESAAAPESAAAEESTAAPESAAAEGSTAVPEGAAVEESAAAPEGAAAEESAAAAESTRGSEGAPSAESRSATAGDSVEGATGPDAPNPAEGPPRWPVELRVQERPARRMQVSVGYGTEDQFRARGEWRHRNFFGGLRKMKLQGKYSFLVAGVEAEFVQPHFVTRDLTLVLDASYSQSTTPAFDTEGYSFGWRIQRPLFEKVTGRLGQRFELREVTDVEASEPLAAARDNESFQLSLLEFGLRRLDVDSEVDPHRGTWFDLSLEPSFRSIGSDVDYLRAVAELRTYVDFFEDLVVATRLRIGVLEALNGDDFDEVPIFKRFFSGGDSSVRGFALDLVGPLDANDDPIGGLSLAEASIELRFPIWRILGGVLFADAGQVSRTALQFELDDTFYAVGGGLRLWTPIGPLRLDVATPLNAPVNFPNVRVHFSVGHTF